MADPYIGEIDLVAHDFPPRGWAQCDGTLLPIAQNQALFSILGTTFGGNGVTTFALPDLRGRVPMSWGTGPQGNVNLGQSGGEVAHTLTTNEMTGHTHTLSGASAPNATSRAIAGMLYGAAQLSAGGAANLYSTGAVVGALSGNTVGQTGGGQGHPNVQPYLAVNFIIALVGIFPSRN